MKVFSREKFLNSPSSMFTRDDKEAMKWPTLIDGKPIEKTRSFAGVTIGIIDGCYVEDAWTEEAPDILNPPDDIQTC